MHILQKIKKLNLSVYYISKRSGIPQSTLSDIITGKSKLLDCTGKTLLLLSKELNISIEELLNLEQDEYNISLEENIPQLINNSIAKLKRARRYNSDFIDCYELELNSNINICEIEQLISKEQANYLRKKYL